MISRVENHRTLHLRTLGYAADRPGMLMDTLDCIIAELEKNHAVPANAIVTLRVEFTEQT